MILVFSFLSCTVKWELLRNWPTLNNQVTTQSRLKKEKQVRLASHLSLKVDQSINPSILTEREDMINFSDNL